MANDGSGQEISWSGPANLGLQFLMRGLQGLRQGRLKPSWRILA
jgi:hypothetical protein